MKHYLSFKTPDVLSQFNWEEFPEEEQGKFQKMVDKYMRYSEYIKICFDTDTGTATVVEK